MAPDDTDSDMALHVTRSDSECSGNTIEFKDITIWLHEVFIIILHNLNTLKKNIFCVINCHMTLNLIGVGRVFEN